MYKILDFKVNKVFPVSVLSNWFTGFCNQYKHLLIVGIMLCLSVASTAQTKKVSLDFSNKPLIEIIPSIEKQTGYLFYYSNTDIDVYKNVTIKIKDAELKDALKVLFEGKGIDFSIINGHIALKKKAGKESPKETRNPKKQDSESNSLINVLIEGVVKSNIGVALEGVSVKIKGTDIGVLSDKEGLFSIRLANSKQLLTLSYVGYTSKEVIISSQNKLQIVLNEATSTLNDVVIIGYGTQKRKDITGAISKVDMADLNKASVRSFDEALAGRIAGVQVSSQDGQPGSPVNIVIRGGNSLTQDNSPLYVIDGFPVEGFNNNLLSPNEIESIDILKDAAATAIYGARGANGVIIISTKKGKEGAPIITYESYYGIQNKLKKIPLLSSYDFVKLQSETFGATNFAALYLTPQNRTVEDYKSVNGYDWQDLLNNTNSPMSNHFISISGGTAQTKYVVSGSASKQDGIIIASNYLRYQGRLSLDQNINTKLKTGVNMSYSSVLQKGTPPSATYSVATSNLMYQAWGYRPVNGLDYNMLDNLYDPDIPTSSNYIVNPVLTAKNELRNATTNNIVINAYLEYLLSKKIKFRTTGGINNSLLTRESFNNSLTNSGGSNSVFNLGVNGSVNTFGNNNWVNENTLTYSNRFNVVHDLVVLAGITESGTTLRNYTFSAIHIPNESLGINGLKEGVAQPILFSSSESTLASMLARINYVYNTKYAFMVTYRADGSSRFAKGNKWSYFPSASFSWRVSKEDFIKRFKYLSDNLNDAKVRLSWGMTGNNRVGDYAYLAQLASPIASVYAFDGDALGNIGANRTAVGNPNLKWETTEQFNAGIDLSLFDHRLSITLDAYKKVTSNLLLNAQLPGSLGFTTAYKNIGGVQNQGVECSISTTNIIKKNFKWMTSFNIAFNVSKVLQLTQDQLALPVAVKWEQNYSSLTPYIAKLNEPISSFYGLISDGVYQYGDFNINSGTSGVKYILKNNVSDNGNNRSAIQPGDVKYKDLNGDNTIDGRDYTIIGRGLPVHVGGFTNNFTYKNFDLNIFFQWSFGNDVLNANRYIFESGYRQNLNQYATYQNRWSPTNQNTDIPRYTTPSNYQYSSRVIEDASYLRLKTVSIGYNFTNNILKRIKFRDMRISLSGQNLVTWTRYSGLDPEVSVRNSALTQGFDFSPYPRSRTFTFNISVRI